MTDKRKDIVRDLARQLGIAMSPATVTNIANQMVPLKFAHRKPIIKEGEDCDHIFYIDKGLVRLFYHKNGKEITEHIACEKELVCCLESYFTHTPSKLTMQTLEPTILYALSYKSLEALTKDSYEVCQLYFAILKNTILLQLRKADMVRFESAKDRYLLTVEHTPEIAARTPLQYLASVLQITPATLSRVRSQVNTDN